MVDPTIEAAREILEDSLDAMRRAIDGAGHDALNWQPAAKETNSIAVLAVHAMHSTRTWLSVATGAPLPARDRSSEFLATATSTGQMLSFFDEMANDCRALMDAEAPFDAGAMRTSGRSTEPDEIETVTAAWALLHAIEHLREHVSHAELTRQLWDQREI